MSSPGGRRTRNACALSSWHVRVGGRLTDRHFARRRSAISGGSDVARARRTRFFARGGLYLPAAYVPAAASAYANLRGDRVGGTIPTVASAASGTPADLYL